MMRIRAVYLCVPAVNPIHEKSAARHDATYNVREMIAFLRGKLLEKHPNQVIVDAGGVGYDVTVPISTFSALPGVGAEIQLRVHTHVREDAFALFGFLTAEEKTVFERLISVSGIGPSLAIKVLSGMPTAGLIPAIRNGEVELLVRIPGVGKKTAERIVLELKDKLEGVMGAAPSAATDRRPPVLNVVEADVLSALLNLGCNRASAEAAVRGAKTEGIAPEFEPLFRRALELVR
jgi:Holliday junction DNA helicase RuvA